MNGKKGTYYEIEQLRKRVELLEEALETLGIIKSKYAQNDFSPDEHDGHKEKQLDTDSILILNNSDNWDKFFEARHSIPVNALEKTIKEDAVSIITDTIVPPENFNEFLSFTHNLISKNNVEYLLFGHLGDCHLHFHLIHSKEDQQIANNIYTQIIKKSSKLGGVYSAEHGTGKRKRNDFIDCYGLEAVNQIKLCKESFE